MLPIEEALAAAAERGASTWSRLRRWPGPPVVKIMDYGGSTSSRKQRQARAAKKKQHVIHLKEVKFRPGIDFDHDFDFKVRLTPGSSWVRATRSRWSR